MHTVSAGGLDIPAVGLGVWQVPREGCAELVSGSIQAGYRHVDTAAMYQNEREVGEGLRHSGLARDAIFLTTKVWMEEIAEGRLQRAAEASLRRLQLDRVDLLLIHWPNPKIDLGESLRALAEVKRQGLARAIGVSNFPSALVEQAVALCPEPLATNQVEYHPYLSQQPVLEACRRSGLALTAYSPLAQGRVVNDPVIAEIAGAHAVSPAQIAVRWLVQQPGVVAIPKSGSVERAAVNLDVDRFELSESEMARISGLARADGRIVNPPFSPAWDAAA